MADTKKYDRFEIAESLGGIGSFALNLKSQEVFWTKGFAAIFGFSDKAKPDLAKFTQLFEQKEKEKLEGGIAKVFRSGERYDISLQSRTVLGQPLHIELVLEIRDLGSDGKQLIGLVRDVTKEVSQKEELVKLSQFVSNSTEGSLIVSTDRIISWSNKALTLLTGIKNNQVLGQDLHTLLQTYIQQDPDNLIDALNQPFLEVTAEVLLRVVSGEEQWFRIKVIKTFDPETDEPNGYVAIFVNIDEKKLAELELQKQNTIIQERNQSILNSITYAKRIQDAILKPQADVLESFQDSILVDLPRDIVSGDFFWGATISETEKILIVADCTGHGVPGALMTVLGSSLLDQIVVEKGITEPSQILLELDQMISVAINQQRTQRPDGMDMAIVNINLEKKTITFSGAKNPLVTVDSSGIERIKGSRFPVGGLHYGKAESKSFETTVLPIEEGLSIYLFTDGYQDQYCRTDGKKFLSKRFRELLNEISGMPPETQEKELLQKLEEHKDGTPQTDDILILGIRF